jgi:hypothetical protein
MPSNQNYLADTRAYPRLVAEAIQSLDMFIGDKVCPKIQVDNPVGSVLRENSRNFLSAANGQSAIVADGAPRNELAQFDRDYIQFTLSHLGFKHNISRNTERYSAYAKNSGISEINRAISIVTRAMMLEKERLAADLFFDGTNWNTNTCTALFGSQMGDAGATPIDYLRDLQNTVMKTAGGVMPDTLIIGFDLKVALGNSPQTQGYGMISGTAPTQTSIAGGGGGHKNDDALAQFIANSLSNPSMRVLFAGALADSSNPGQAGSNSLLWTGDNLWMGTTGTANAAVTGNQVTASPVGALNIYSEALTVRSEANARDMGTCVYGDEYMGFVKVNEDLGYTLTDCLA